MKVLLIEDNPGDALLVKTALSKVPEGVKFDWVDQLSKGIACLKKDEIDIVVIDLSLPDSWGLETILKIREEAHHVPIVVLTGSCNADVNVGVEAVRHGAQDYLLKDQLDYHVLFRVLRYAVERHRSERLLQQKVEELEKMNEIMLDREERILDLKKHIRHLEDKIRNGSQHPLNPPPTSP